MRKMTKKISISRIVAWLLVALMIGAMAVSVSAAYPKADDFVADEAGVLSESTIRQIKKTNKDLMDSVGVTIAVCTIETTDGTPIAEYARELFTEWKMGEGVLLLIASEDKNYYIVQSTGIDESITNEDLTFIRDGYLEEDFASGNIDSGVIKTVSKLASELEADLDEVPSSGSSSDDEEKEKNEGTTFGAVLVGILKVILYIALFALAAFIILFVVAMFNDDAAAILQKYVFRRGKTNPAPAYYDERLYGSRSGNQRQGQRPQSGSQRQGYSQNNSQRPRNPGNGANQQRRPGRNPNQIYNADGTPRRPRQNQQSGRNGQGGYGNYNDYNDYNY
ncbi:MAG: hypothetical protein E7628_04930 [Ruminococcaceae bacterium]|nr:hypothetical protein [Oscillospiraceae bacterium]